MRYLAHIAVLVLLTACSLSLLPPATGTFMEEHYTASVLSAENRSGINDLAFVPGKNTITAVTEDGYVEIYNYGGNLRTSVKLDKEPFCLDVRPDGTEGVVGSMAADGVNSSLYLLNTVTGKVKREIVIPHRSIDTVDYSNDGERLAVVTRSGRIFLYNTSDMKRPGSFDLRSMAISVCFSPDDSFLLAGDKDGNLYVYHRGAGNLSVLTGAHEGAVVDVLWFNETTLVSCGTDGIIKIYDENLTVLSELTLHDAEITTLSSWGRYMISGGMDGRAAIWDLTKKKPLYQLGKAAVNVFSSDFHPDGSKCCFGLADSSMILVDLDPDGDGVELERDAFPYDPSASSDIDLDGYPGEWNEGKDEGDSATGLYLDAFPNDPSASLDTDGDGYPDGWNALYSADNSTSPPPLRVDAFPYDPSASLDKDGDGRPDEWNIDMTEEDSTEGLKLDVFPDDPDEWSDSDWPLGDGIGDNGDWLSGFNNYLFYVILTLLVAVLVIVLVRTARAGGTSYYGALAPDAEGRRIASVTPKIDSDHSPARERITGIIPDYSITHRIGDGGFATVYKAKGLEHEKAAIKLPKDLGETLDVSTYRKFEAEAAIWKNLEHPNIVEFYGSGTEPVPYIAMELMEGGNLRDLLDERGLELRDSAKIMISLLDAVSHAHRMATVHRDLKPENILFTASGTPKISDWGIGKFMAGGEVNGLSEGGKTLAYCAPEQLDPDQFGEVDWSTDIFQLGIIFYELLTGENPFGAEDTAAAIKNIVGGTPPAPTAVSPGLPNGLDVIIMRALAKRKAERWRSADIMYEKLASLLSGMGQR